ncbi:hypothetical protein B1218_37335, partial [Pseudomonas ogarae]
FFTNGEVGKPLSDAADYASAAAIGLRSKVPHWPSPNPTVQNVVNDVLAVIHICNSRQTLGCRVLWSPTPSNKQSPGGASFVRARRASAENAAAPAGQQRLDREQA